MGDANSHSFVGLWCVPLRLDYMFQLHATMLMGHGWERGERERVAERCVACVKLHLSDFLACSTQTQNYICRWEMPHNQVTTTECRVDRHGRLKEEGRRGSWVRLHGNSALDRQNWQLTDAIGASWRSDMCTSLPLSLFHCLAVNCISSKHFCGCFWQNKGTLE